MVGLVAASFTGQWYHFGHFSEAFWRVPDARFEQVFLQRDRPQCPVMFQCWRPS